MSTKEIVTYVTNGRSGQLVGLLISHVAQDNVDGRQLQRQIQLGGLTQAYGIGLQIVTVRATCFTGIVNIYIY